ncbi:MAG: LCP family protein, partial [Oscillospiraceae bacterium]
MTKKYKIVSLIIAFAVLISSTAIGVWAAQKVSTISFGESVNIQALDDASNIGMLNFLILGVDEDGTRCDTMMLASLDGYSERVSVLSIPRDTRIILNDSHQKINATVGVGQERAKSGEIDEPEEVVIEEVKRLTGLPIHYFITVNFSGFIDIINVLGGVDFDVKYDMNYDDPTQNLHIHFKKGQQHLDGQAAHDFVRFRHNNGGTAPGEYVMGDLGRIHWQQEFIKALMSQKLKPQYFMKINEIFGVVKDNVRTNYDMSDLMKQTNLVKSLSPENVQTYQLPGDSEYIDDLWWFIQDDEKIAELVHEYFMPMSKEEWESKKTADAEKAAAAVT